MRAILFVAAVAAMIFATAPVSAGQPPQAPINPTVRCQGLNTPCALQPPPVRVNVGNPYAERRMPPQGQNYRMPFTQQNVGGRQMVILPQHRGSMGTETHRVPAVVQRSHRPSGPLWEEHVAGCEAKGLNPNVRLANGDYNCHREPRLTIREW
ncbi:MAG: hypothetical protein UY70_C0014G0011 [Candidatus Kaiserbacteria bacterium GW2011_GWB1_52_6]|uniref:Secreted protein n=2 Tax=Candidatus Kaiseribacteriota TaxID=1752734 RepID=A0A0G1X8S5_9BACT|nr:MAG: hypothetical protein UY67_C0011G0032 [Candidatus Kaiserbacteria bacterium GW2011_GWA2_52_12]KKW27446.1 MAG: hypothetical protein UY70_C0014G0011 [Candidatus Kaiserbacteria bacterium GW2011_GWB1_52_6]